MSRDADQFDFFVSYARGDNAGGWISQFVQQLLEEHRTFSGGCTLVPFFDTEEIRSLDDWRVRIYDGVTRSRLFLAFLSPRYFASEWCRREWQTWIDTEIAKHILSAGAAPVYIVEVPGLDNEKEREDRVARAVVELCSVPPPHEQFVTSASTVIRQVRRRQLQYVAPFYRDGIEALRRDDLRKVLAQLARDFDEGAERLRKAAESETTVPPYNKRFSGRLDELLDLRERLKDDRAGVISGVHGLGGIGKTELAYTYAHAFAGAYPGGRFLIRCEGRTSLREAALDLGNDVFRERITDEERKTTETYFHAVAACLRERLEHLGHILLVLDNVTDLTLLSPPETDALTTLGPTLHLLATTRVLPPMHSTGRAAWLTLGELPEADALTLLEKHRPFADEVEQEAARRIVRRLGGFTLAVELVAAWLGVHSTVTCAGFLERLGLEDTETLDALAADRNVALRRHDHERRLAAALGPTLATLSPVERRAMEYASLLAPDHVALPWLQSLVGHDFPETGAAPRPGHDNPWEELCANLRRLALVHDAGDEGERTRIVRVHRLVQDLVRNEAERAELEARQLAVERLIQRRAAELQRTKRWGDDRWEVEPLDALGQLWAESERPGAAWLLGTVAQSWHSLAEWTRAEPLMRRALAIDEASYSPDHPNVATELNNLAQLLKATNRLAEAEPLMRRALTIDEASYSPDHPNVATELNNLAQLLKATNRLAEAEPLMRRALAIDEASYGPDHPDVAIRLNNLAAMLQATNRLAEAEPLMRRALAIDEASYGPDHPDVATDLNNLAQLLQATNRLAEAEPLMRRALAIDEASYGPDHPKVAIRLNNLAQLFQDTNRLAEAEPLMRRALTIDEASYSPDHPNVATELNNLAQLLKATNRLAEAEPLMRRALAIDEASYGPDHPNVARDLNNLAQLLKATNRLAEAEPLMQRALAIDEASYGPDHPNVATDLNNLAQLFQATNRLAEAEPLMRRALAIDEASYGPDHPEVATDLNNLAQLLKATNRLAAAEPLMRRALAIDEASYGPDHPNVGIQLNNLAQLFQATNRLAEAEPLMRRALAIAEASYGPDHPNVATVLNNLAQLLQTTNRFAEAESLMRRALAIRNR